MKANWEAITKGAPGSYETIRNELCQGPKEILNVFKSLLVTDCSLQSTQIQKKLFYSPNHAGKICLRSHQFNQHKKEFGKWE